MKYFLNMSARAVGVTLGLFALGLYLKPVVDQVLINLKLIPEQKSQ